MLNLSSKNAMSIYENSVLTLKKDIQTEVHHLSNQNIMLLDILKGTEFIVAGTVYETEELDKPSRYHVKSLYDEDLEIKNVPFSVMHEWFVISRPLDNSQIIVGENNTAISSHIQGEIYTLLSLGFKVGLIDPEGNHKQYVEKNEHNHLSYLNLTFNEEDIEMLLHTARYIDILYVDNGSNLFKFNGYKNDKTSLIQDFKGVNPNLEIRFVLKSMSELDPEQEIFTHQFQKVIDLEKEIN